MELLTPETLTAAKEGNELLFSFGRYYQMNVEMSVFTLWVQHNVVNKHRKEAEWRDFHGDCDLGKNAFVSVITDDGKSYCIDFFCFPELCIPWYTAETPFLCGTMLSSRR